MEITFKKIKVSVESLFANKDSVKCFYAILKNAYISHLERWEFEEAKAVKALMVKLELLWKKFNFKFITD